MIGEPITLSTSLGPAAVRVHAPTEGSRGTIVLGHGAGGALGSWPQDLRSVLQATSHGWTVVLVEQPWRVAGRKVATRPPTLDAAWSEIVPALPGTPLPRPLVYGGRSAGARVACRTSSGNPDTDLPRADAVLCLAFPLHPPGRPDKSRAPELLTPVRLGIPTLVVQGRADPFGTPAEVREALSAGPEDTQPGSTQVELVDVPGNHSPSRDQGLVTRTVLSWLEQLG
ncbi:alpha/beta hydrolase family protein [Ornithinimicrobium faecis]|uniref:KANL3/Tex30 alpha/beta hydrolase-like domain-containing protein n=1 Tax=Ornithinimicrobium faecis TaxID=2934158 RepID=A0ABY4YPZ4_9MICO|nr:MULTISPECIES: alpha/beta family hydrolase [unclassified Ornithinimicrobium]USQ78834.1 hypothetical protein NF556_14530 [Ornithinimicrobium sp. HY1793]